MSLKCLAVVPPPGLKGGQRLGCGNSFWEAIPLLDGVDGEGLLLVQGFVVGKIKEA